MTWIRWYVTKVINHANIEGKTMATSEFPVNVMGRVLYCTSS